MDLIFICLFMVTVASNLDFTYSANGRILNGLDATRGQFPYQVLLLQDTFRNTTEFCGGALISKKFVLTAAHCTYETYRSHVFLGAVDTKSGVGVVRTTVESDDVFNHPYYDPTNFQNDISLIQLSFDYSFSDQIQPIALTKSGWASPSTFDNYEVTASGWGQTYDNQAGTHQILQYRRVFVMPHAKCVAHHQTPVTDGMICTDKKAVFAGPCKGDSGGPLTVKLQSGLYLIGLVSWTVGSCSSAEPIVYTNVGHYLKWINSITGIPIPQ